MQHSKLSLTKSSASKLVFLFFLFLLIAGCASKPTGRIKVEQQTIAGAGQSNESISDPSIITAESLLAPDDHVLGNASAPLTIVEFSDYQCPYCREFFVKTEPGLKNNYIETGKVKFIYKDYPLTEVHNNSVVAAKSAQCASQQGKYWEMHDILFKKVESWNTDTPANDLIDLADSISLDHDAFVACVTSQDSLAKTREDFALGKKLGLKGTPVFFIGTKKIEGSIPYNDLKAIIEGELARR